MKLRTLLKLLPALAIGTAWLGATHTWAADAFPSKPIKILVGFPPGGSYLDPNTGGFDWAPGFDQHGVYTIQFTVSDGTTKVTNPTSSMCVVSARVVFDVSATETMEVPAGAVKPKKVS